MLIFPRKQQWDTLFGCETHAERAIITQSWDYLVYLRDLAVHMDHLPHHRMMSQSAKQLCNYDPQKVYLTTAEPTLLTIDIWQRVFLA